MATRRATSGGSLTGSLCASVLLHILCIAALLFWQKLAPAPTVRQETYYVDVVNLPVASPRAGSPAPLGSMPNAPSSPAPQAEEKAMTLPPPRKAADSGTQNKKLEPAPANTSEINSDSFAKRMARLEGKVASGRYDATVDRLRRQVTSGGGGDGRSGMPGGKGQEAGSDYTAYIQSRLKDAFRTTISFSSRSPQVVVRITIDSGGRLARKKIQQSSGDHTFELAVLRAIDMASTKFPPPPDKRMFEGIFVFKPQGISNGKP